MKHKLRTWLWVMFYRGDYYIFLNAKKPKITSDSWTMGPANNGSRVRACAPDFERATGIKLPNEKATRVTFIVRVKK
jgi:hypothetical protein